MALNSEPNGNGNGDEGSNRTFRVAAMALGGIGLLGVILIAVALISGSGQRAQLLAQQQSVNATNEAVALAAAATATPEPTETSEPTATPKPPTATPTLPPTAAPTQAPAGPVVVTSAAVATTGPASPGLATSTPKSANTPAAVAGQLSGIGPKATPTLNVPSSTNVTSSVVVSGTTQLPDKIAPTGAGDFLGFIVAGGLLALLIVARRLRMSQA